MALPDPSVTEQLETEEQCSVYLESLRWPNGIACPSCGNQKISRFQAKGKSGKTRNICQCLNKDCKHQFTVTTGSIFHDSHLPLSKWFEAMRLLGDPALDVTVNQLRFVLDVQYKTAKNIVERAQRALAAGTIELAELPEEVSTTLRSVVPPREVPAARQPVIREPLPRPVPVEMPAVRAVPRPSPASQVVPLAAASQRHGAQAARQRAVDAAPSPSPTAKPEATPSMVDSMLAVFTSAVNLSVKPPLAAANYLKKKILD